MHVLYERLNQLEIVCDSVADDETLADHSVLPLFLYRLDIVAILQSTTRGT